MHKDAPPSADVRMHGFRQRSEVPAVLDWIDRHAARLGDETVPLDEAAGRILATEVIAPLDVPAFDRAAMDGYALRGAETSGASEYNPLAFPVLGQAMPGQPFAGAVAANAAVRIMTGAPVPDRARCGRAGRIRDRDGGADRDHAPGRPRPARRTPRRGHRRRARRRWARAGACVRRTSVCSPRWAWRT